MRSFQILQHKRPSDSKSQVIYFKNLQEDNFYITLTVPEDRGGKIARDKGTSRFHSETLGKNF